MISILSYSKIPFLWVRVVLRSKGGIFKSHPLKVWTKWHPHSAHIKGVNWLNIWYHTSGAWGTVNGTVPRLLHKPKSSDVNACESVLAVNNTEQHGAMQALPTLIQRRMTADIFIFLNLKNHRLCSNRHNFWIPAPLSPPYMPQTSYFTSVGCFSLIVHFRVVRMESNISKP